LIHAWVLVVALLLAANDDGSQLYAALSANLAPDANRPVARLAQVSVDPTGDATIVFAIRNENDDASAIRAGAMADTLTVLRTVYESSPASGVSSVTVLGTFPFQSTKGKSVRESPVLRAVLSADRAEQIDWNQLAPSDVPTAVDVWWLQGAFADVVTPDSPAQTGETVRDRAAASDAGLLAPAESDVPPRRPAPA
jgi:hypothetical protein